MNNELTHWGILGMKWGVRRYQNADGTYTKQGKRRYLNRDGELTKVGKWQKNQDEFNAERGRIVTERNRSIVKTTIRPTRFGDKKKEFKKINKDFINDMIANYDNHGKLAPLNTGKSVMRQVLQNLGGVSLVGLGIPATKRAIKEIKKVKSNLGR